MENDRKVHGHPLTGDWGGEKSYTMIGLLMISYQPMMSRSSRKNLALMSKTRTLYPMRQVSRGKNGGSRRC